LPRGKYNGAAHGEGEPSDPLLDNPAVYKDFLTKVPLGRWGNLEEIGGLIVLPASDARPHHRGGDHHRRGLDHALKWAAGPTTAFFLNARRGLDAVGCQVARIGGSRCCA
jgi:hypothetical protein